MKPWFALWAFLLRNLRRLRPEGKIFLNTSFDEEKFRKEVVQPKVALP